MSTYLYPYKAGSESAKNLAEGLGIKRIALENSKFKGSPDKTVINWGASSVSEEVAKCRVINKPECVAIAANKLEFFKKLITYNKAVSSINRVMFPSYTESRDIAEDWVEGGNIVIARTIVNGHSGNGIVVVENNNQMVDAPLYTLYIPKKQEYRVHVAGMKAVDVQRKARREDVPDDQINWRIRNHDNGFVFARNEGLGNVPGGVLQNSINAIRGIGLDFGAVDVVFNEKHGQAYVLEVNTAPGLSGETLENYVKNMTELVLLNEKQRKTKPPSWDAADDVSLDAVLSAGTDTPSNALMALGINSDKSFLNNIVGVDSDGRMTMDGVRVGSLMQRPIIQWINQNSPSTIMQQLNSDVSYVDSGRQRRLIPALWRETVEPASNRRR